MQFQTENRKPGMWTREKIGQLIELYKNHECLWNHWHKAYKSKDKRNRAIEDICAKLNIEKFEFGKKIHNLRNQFNTELKKLEQRIEETGSSIDDTKDAELRCKWSHFESLMFLRHVIEPRPGGYQGTFHPAKKVRLKFDFNKSEDDTNATTMLHSNSSICNNENTGDLPSYQYDDTVNEVITGGFHSFENDIVEVDQAKCNEEICDKKYSDLSPATGCSFIKSSKHKNTLHIPHTSSTSSSQTDININNDSSVLQLNANNGTVSPKHTHSSPGASVSQPVTTHIMSPITSSNASIRAPGVLCDQWDSFGELVANEFRNLNSDVSRKRLKRKILQSMLEIGEEDDNLINNKSRNNK